MSVSYEGDLKEVLAQINQRLERIEQKTGSLKEEINDLKVGQARLEEKVEELTKRIDSQEFVVESSLD